MLSQVRLYNVIQGSAGLLLRKTSNFYIQENNVSCLGQVEFGQMRSSQVWLCWVMLGQVKCGQIRPTQGSLGWVMLGWVRMVQVSECYALESYVRFDYTLLVQVRLGQPMLGQVRQVTMDQVSAGWLRLCNVTLGFAMLFYIRFGYNVLLQVWICYVMLGQFFGKNSSRENKDVLVGKLMLQIMRNSMYEV